MRKTSVRISVGIAVAAIVLTATTIGISVLSASSHAALTVSPVKAKDIAAYLMSLGPWVDPAKTVDTFKAGNPEREVRTVVVSWMSTLEALQRARTMDCDLFITHEPTFYSHTDDDPSYDTDKATFEKRRLLSQTGMVIYRCHDVWDKVPGTGILASWAKALGIEGQPLVHEGYYAVYSVPDTTVEAFAAGMARRLQRFGQEAVQVTGDFGARVRRLAIGTGAVTTPKEMYALGADAAVVTEVVYWRDVRWAKDMGFPLFIVDHAVSECPGVENLAAEIRKKFPSLRVEYIQEGCPYRLVGPDGPI